MEENKIDNPPAFPRPCNSIPDNRWAEANDSQEGMTLRDYFAAMAMRNCITPTINPHSFLDRLKLIYRWFGGKCKISFDKSWDVDSDARHSYKIADAMLKSRQSK